MGLKEYQKKRDFRKTSEPRGIVAKSGSRAPRFVIQKHSARSLHYDLRLEMESVLRSWAVPKGPSLRSHEKRLAMQVEDHPLDYGDFEGTIPEGQYGAGSVIVWDRGTYVPEGDPVANWRQGKLEFELRGQKLKGRWMLVQMKGRSRKGNEWLFFKKDDPYADENEEITESRPESVISGKTVEQVGEQSPARWHTALERTLEDLGVKKQPRAVFPAKVQAMLATLVDAPFDDNDWIFEIKYDGIRTIAYKQDDKVRLLSRNQNVVGQRYPELVQQLRKLPAREAVLDGEICALDPEGRSRFQLLQARMHVGNEKQIEVLVEQVPVVYFVFDILYCNSFDLCKLPLLDRKKVLREAIGNEELVRFSDHISAEGSAFFKACCKSQLEGIVGKRADSLYQQRRTRDWLKIKCIEQSDFVIGGWTQPAGARKHFGALLLGQYEDSRLRYVGRVGSGFDQAGLARVFRELEKREQAKPPFSNPPRISGAHWVSPALVCQVKFNEWTREGNLRAPIFLGMHPDRDAKACRYQEAVPVKEVLEATERPGRGNAPKVPAGGARNKKLNRRVGSERLTELQSSKLRFSNLDKLYWPKEGYTKGDLILFYDQIADTLLPYLKDRPLTLKRHPDGIQGEFFYQKDAPEHIPDWIRTERVRSESVRKWIDFIVCNDRETLLYLANLGCIEQHPWNSRVGSLDDPDWIIFDLDPEKVAFKGVQEVALVLKEVLDRIGIEAYPKTSGASGIHVFVPIINEFSYDDVRNFGQLIAEQIVASLPRLATTERLLKKRHKKVYVDYLQSGKGKHVVAPYVLRPLSGAPVSTPLEWEELEKPIDPGEFNIETIFARLEKKGDLFAPVLGKKQDLRKLHPAIKGPSRQR